MPTYRGYTVTIFPDVLTAAVHVTDILSMDLPLNVEQVAEITGSRTRPSHAAVHSIQPTMGFSSYALESLIDAIGAGGLSVDSDTDPGITMYQAKLDDYGAVTAGSVHRSYTMKKGVIVPMRLTCEHRGDASLQVMAYPIKKATNQTIIEADNAALPAVTVTSERWTLGPIILGGVTLADFTSLDIDFGFQIAPVGVQSNVENTYIGVRNQIPKITIRGFDPSWLSSGIIPYGAKALTHAGPTAIYLRKRKQDGDHFYALGTNNHIKITTAGIGNVGNAVQWQATRLSETDVQISSIEDSAGNAPLIITTATTHP